MNLRQELAAMITLARRVVASGTPGTLSTLFSARGSTYRPLGSMMVSLPGMHAGGVSGGCLEEYVARAGERATRKTPAAMLRFNTHPDSDADAPVPGCGGTIDLLVERLTLDHVTLLEELARAHERDDYSQLASVVRRTGGSLALTREWLARGEGTGGARPGAAAWAARESARSAMSHHAAVDADTDVLGQYVPPLTRLLIFGAGDDALPLCEIGSSLGWQVSVADRRARLATRARFPRAHAVIAADWDEVVDGLAYSPRTAAVLMTHNLADDARVLSLLSGRPLAYIGALGPAHRRQWLLDEAESLGTGLDDGLRLALRGPIGLNLGDRSAAGIAVAVTAEILARISGRSARSQSGQVEMTIGSARPGACRVA